MHLTCIRAAERVQVIFLRPDGNQGEGIFRSLMISLTPTLSLWEREFRGRGSFDRAVINK